MKAWIPFLFAATASAQCGLTINWTDPSCQVAGSTQQLTTATVNGTPTSNAWSIISRHGEYAQSEDECNVPGAITVASSLLTVTAKAQSTSCRDFNPSTGNPTGNSSGPWDYWSGDVQWNAFSFLYGTIEFRMQFPNKTTKLWPAIWMLATNCQAPNKFTGDPGTGGCPLLGNSGYQEIDIVECIQTLSPGWCNFVIYNPGDVGSFNFDTDTSFHTYDFVWTTTGAELFRDGTSLGSVTTHVPNAMFLIFQIQEGGPSSPVNGLLPATANLDWVKVCDSSYTRTQCDSAALPDAHVIFYDDFVPATTSSTSVAAGTKEAGVTQQ